MTTGEFRVQVDRLRSEIWDAVARFEQARNAQVTALALYRDANNLPEIKVEAFTNYKIDGIVGTRVPRVR